MDVRGATSEGDGQTVRARLPDASTGRLIASHGAAVMVEWASIIAVLVSVYDAGGSVATGAASLGLLAVAFAAAPLSGAAVDRAGAHRARLAGLLAQSFGCGLAAVAGAADLPLGVMLAGAVTALGGATTLRPTGAMLMPVYAKTSTDLVTANVWIWSVEGSGVLVGPLLAALLLWSSGPPATLAVCAVVCLVGAAITAVDLGTEGPPRHGADETRGVAATWQGLGGRPGLRSVLVVIWAQYAIIGSFDFVLVVVARDDLQLGDAGPAILGAAFGVGAVIALFGASRVLGRARLAVVLGIALAVAAAALVAFGALLTVAAAFVALPVIGACRSLLDGAGRMMLQRSIGPSALRSVFTIRELLAGAGMISGGAFSLVALQLGGSAGALVSLGLLLMLVLAASARGLSVADDSADVPVVEMSLLRRVPMFSPLPTLALEAVARAATTASVPSGDIVVRQGDVGDRFYVVADGAFDVCMSGNHVRTARRGEFFGEVALLADVPRTATVTAETEGTLLAIDRVDFLTALTGTDSSRLMAWSIVDAMDLEPDMLPARRPDLSSLTADRAAES